MNRDAILLRYRIVLGIFGCVPLLYCLRLTQSLRGLDSPVRA